MVEVFYYSRRKMVRSRRSVLHAVQSDRLREHREPVARPRHRATAGAEHPRGARRVTVATRAPAPRREPPPLGDRCDPRPRVHAVGQPPAGAAAFDLRQQRLPHTVDRLADRRVHGGGRDRHRSGVRNGPCSARHARPAERRVQSGRTRQCWRDPLRPGQPVRRRSGRALAGARRRRRPLRADVRLARDARCRLRAQPGAHRHHQPAASASGGGGRFELFRRALDTAAAAPAGSARTARRCWPAATS